jgi:hypothetical protein
MEIPVRRKLRAISGVAGAISPASQGEIPVFGRVSSIKQIKRPLYICNRI